MKKEEIKAYVSKTTDRFTEITFRNGEIKVGSFEDTTEDNEMFAKNEWHFIETSLNKKQLLKGSDIILINTGKQIPV